MPRKKVIPILTDVCAFCQKQENNPILGDIIEKCGLKFHINCIFAASGLSQERDESRTDDEYIHGFHIAAIQKELRRGRSLCCSFCRSPGASVGCVVGSCPCSFHLPCITKANGITIFEDPFPSYCKKHSPRQNLDSLIAQSVEAPTCCVCLFSVLPEDTPDVMATTARVHSAVKRISAQNITASTPMRAVANPRAERSLPRRSCMTVSTPKRIRVSVRCEVQKLSVSNSSSWEVSDTLTLSDTEAASTPTPTRLSSERPVLSATAQAFQSTLAQLPEWLRNYLAALPPDRQRPSYQSWLHDIIHGMCCPKAWMHRGCIAGYAVSAALHYLKCPYCADKQTFIRSVIGAGIWVPDRDAAWELEPGAFAELVPTRNTTTTATVDSSAHTEPDSRERSPSLSSKDSDSEALTEASNSRARQRRERRPTVRQSVRQSNTRPQQPRRTEPANSKTVLSLVWTGGQSGGGRRKSRQASATAAHKSPEAILSQRGNSTRRQHLSMFPENRLRQATLGSFLSNFRVSLH